MVQREWDKRLSSPRESYQAIKDKLPMDLSHWSQSRNGRGAASCRPSGLGPGSVLRSRPRVALSSAQALSAYITVLRLVHVPLLRLGSSPRGCHRQLLRPRGPDCLGAAGELVRRSDVRDGAVQPDRVVVSHELGDEPSSVVQAQRRLDANVWKFMKKRAVMTVAATRLSATFEPPSKRCKTACRPSTPRDWPR